VQQRQTNLRFFISGSSQHSASALAATASARQHEQHLRFIICNSAAALHVNISIQKPRSSSSNMHEHLRFTSSDLAVAI
jgi:hypothetical protein